MRVLVLFLSLGLSAPAMGQAGVTALLDRLNSVDPQATTAADCAAQVAQAANLNAPDLLYGASVCYAVRRPVEGNFLLNAGQVRSIADMALMVPASRQDSDVLTGLYGVIYFYAGGPGRDEVLRDAALRERFFALFDSWSPAYAADYNPGWNTRRRPDGAAYQAAMAESKAGRRQQLAEIVLRYTDEAYYALHRRFQELQARNPRGFDEGTPDARLSLDLLRQMNERSTALGIAPHVADADPGEPAGGRFPPAVPAAEEVAAVGDADATARWCADLAERRTIASDSRIERVLITRSPEWGTIWRADIGGGDRPAERFTCTSNTSASQPLDMGDGPVPPLP